MCRSVEKRDAIDELTTLFNAMLDRIEGLVTGMRGALDNVSHDLRTPMTHLRGSAELALAGPADLDRYREALADCVEEADRVLVMLTTLMDISEAESGAIELHRETGAARRHRRARRRAVSRYGGSQRRGARRRMRTTVVVGPSIACASSRSRPTCSTTPSNTRRPAVAWTSRSDARARAAPSYASATPESAFPTAELPRIWERLFRGDQSRTERGLGLGLSLVKAIVEAHGGTVSVESTPGHGSTFSVNLQLTS